MIIVRTPLRLSFVGGGSDMKSFYDNRDGKVICTAIDKYVYAIVKERFDDLIYINYSVKECVEKVDDIQHDLVREAMRITGVDKGVEITTLADIPSSGSGLGSSSSITVALLHAFYAYKQQLVTAEQLAMDACRIEIEIMKKPIGRQDQYAAAYGGVNKFTFKRGEETRRDPVNLDPTIQRNTNDAMLLYYTGITRKADNILSQQQQNLARADKMTSLGNMVDLVDPYTEAMAAGDINTCGSLLAENWRLKKMLASGIANPEIDAMYQTAMDAGALSGKIAGAGGGGFMILLVPLERRNKVRSAMAGYREFPFMIESGGSKIIFEESRYSSKP